VAPESRPSESAKPSGDNQYAIAPFGKIQMSAQERALVADRVQRRAARKYHHLVDRETGDAGAADDAHAGAADSEAKRALDAESWFRKGRDLLKARKYDKAAEAFGMSSHLDPNEGEYVAHLGYTLYLLKPNDEMVRREALEDIARGIKLSPDRELPYVFLGRIFKVTGEVDKAEKMFRRALKIRPHSREAATELRLIEMREQKKTTGLLGRLLK